MSYCPEEMSNTSELVAQFSLVRCSIVDPVERYERLIEQDKVYGVEDYAARPSPFSPSWRRRIAEWLFQVADAYHLSRETVSIAMSFLDRYLSKTTVNKKFFQLASMTAFFLAAKMQESRPVKMSNLINLSRGVFKVQDLKSMEKVMLRQLKWHINPPTPGSFVRLFLYYLEEESEAILRSVLEVAEWSTELSTVEYYFIRFKPRTVAMASILIAFEKSPNPPSAETIKKFHNSIVKELNFDFKASALDQCQTALMKMYNASNIEEDMKNDAEVEQANNKLLSPKPNQNVRVVSPTAVEDVKNIEKGKTVKKEDIKQEERDEDEDEDLDEEVAGINKAIIEVGVTQREHSRTVSRCSGNYRGSSNSRSSGNYRSSTQNGGSLVSVDCGERNTNGKGSVVEAASQALKECIEESNLGSGTININIADNMSNFKVTARSRPSSSMSNPPVRPASRADSSTTLILTKSSSLPSSISSISSRGRRNSYDSASTLRQVKMAKGEGGSPILNRKRNCPSCPPGMEGGIGPDAGNRVRGESERNFSEESMKEGKKRPHFCVDTQVWEVKNETSDRLEKELVRSKRAHSTGTGY